MENDVKHFFNVTTKKLELIEKKIQEMKMNIVIMSFYSDLNLIEDTLLGYQSQGYKINDALFEKIAKFKLMLQSNKNLPALGKKFIEVTEEFYKLRKQINKSDGQSDSINNKNKKPEEPPRQIKKKIEDFYLSYT